VKFSKEALAKREATRKKNKEALARRAPQAISEARFYLEKAIAADPPRGAKLTPRQIFTQLALAALEGKV
jgi:hypothetical protein